MLRAGQKPLADEVDIFAVEPIETYDDSEMILDYEEKEFLKNVTSKDIVDQLGFGWNLGNTFDAWNSSQNQGLDSEISWGNPETTVSMIDANRDIKAKRAVIADIKDALPIDYNGEDWENKNIGELYTKIERIRKENYDIEYAKSMIDGHDQKIRKFQADREIGLAALDREITAEGNQIDTELASLEERIKSLREKKSGLTSKKADREKAIEAEYKAAVAKFEGEITEYTELAKKNTTPIDDLVAEADNTEKMKAFVGEWKRMLDIEDDVERLVEKSELLTEKINKARTLPAEILSKSKLPISNMSVGKDNIVLIDGKPISNLSQGEQMDLCMDIGLANVEGLQLILLDGVESLSDDLKAQVYKRCKDAGVQIIATRTTNDDELKVVEI